MGKMFAAVLVAVVTSSAAYGQATRSGASSCDSLAHLDLPSAKIRSAQEVATGTFTPPPAPEPPRGGAAFYASLPKFCRVSVEDTPSADSDIKIEVWLPSSGWNGKLQGQGNGGFAGEIDYHGTGIGVTQGYATVGTDTGHSASMTGASWALGHPEKVTDFGYRAIHQMTQIAKAAIEAFYGGNPQHSYFAACSNGGRQALMEAQRFPGRLRRYHRRSARQFLDALADERDSERAGHHVGSGQLYSSQQTAGNRAGSECGMRRAGWRDGRNPQRPAEMPLRTGNHALQRTATQTTV